MGGIEPKCPYNDGFTGYRCTCENPEVEHAEARMFTRITRLANNEIDQLMGIINSQEREINRLQRQLMMAKRGTR
jgi:hypothetical protein